MSPDLLVGTYKRYKAGTNKLISWLSQAAEQTSRNSSLSTSTPFKSTPQKKAAGTRKIGVDQLVTLAQAIVQSVDPAIEIPIDILDVAKDAINGRKWACRWYEAYSTTRQDGSEMSEDITMSNSRHRYFLNVLENVFEVLRIEFRKRQPKRKKKIELPTDKEDLSNVFSYLELEEPSVESETPTSGTAKKPNKMTLPKPPVELVSSEPEDAQGDQFFAIWCYLMDLWELRLQTRKIWHQYAAGDISFFVACQTFDKAVQIAENLAIELQRDEGVCCFHEIMKMLGEKEYMIAARMYQINTANLDAFSVQEASIENQCEFLLMPAWCAMQDFQTLGTYLRNGKPQHARKNEYPGMSLPTHPFAQALMQLAGDLFPFAVSDCCSGENKECGKGLDPLMNQVSDRYTKWLIVALANGDMSPGLLSATQMYFDLYDILGGDLDRGRRECMPRLEQMKLVVDEYEIFFRSQSEEMQNGIGTRSMSWLRGFQEIVLPDQSEGGREGWVLKLPEEIGNLKPLTTFVPLNIIATLPSLAGNIVNMVICKTQVQGMTLCNLQQVVLSAAHLYRGAQEAGLLTREWHDMAWIIVRENENTKFVRAGDGTLRGVAANFSMALGLSLPDVARAHRPPLPRPATVFRHCMKLGNLNHFMLGAENMGRSNPHKCQGYCEKNNLAFRPYLDLRDMYTAVNHYSKTAKIKDEALAKQWTETKKVSASQLLQLMQEIFVGDEVYLNLNLVQLFQRCIELFCRIQEVSPSGPRKNNHLPPAPHSVVYEALWEAAGNEHRAKRFDGTLLFLAGQIMDDIIIREGDEGIRQAHELSSGFIPDDLRPATLYGPAAVRAPSKTASYPHALPVRYVYVWREYQDAWNAASAVRTASEMNLKGIAPETEDSTKGAMVSTKSWSTSVLTAAELEVLLRMMEAGIINPKYGILFYDADASIDVNSWPTKLELRSSEKWKRS